MIRCSILNEDIDEGVCVTIVDVTENHVKDTVISEKIKQVSNWEKICIGCKYHDN